MSRFAYTYEDPDYEISEDLLDQQDVEDQAEEGEYADL